MIVVTQKVNFLFPFFSSKKKKKKNTCCLTGWFEQSTWNIFLSQETHLEENRENFGKMFEQILTTTMMAVHVCARTPVRRDVIHANIMSQRCLPVASCNYTPVNYSLLVSLCTRAYVKKNRKIDKKRERERKREREKEREEAGSRAACVRERLIAREEVV